MSGLRSRSGLSQVQTDLQVYFQDFENITGIKMATSPSSAATKGANFAAI